MPKYRSSWIFRAINGVVLAAFFFLNVLPTPAMAQVVFQLPAPGAMVPLSPAFMPAIIKGIKLHPDNPLRFDFIIDTGDSGLRDKALQDETSKLIKYFLASLTVPEDDLWVNLSPHEKDRIIPNEFGVTEMGRDLLAQDYLLKQITSSLLYPDSELGKKFWDRVYKKAKEKYGTIDIPVNTFNKVWVIPDKARIYKHDNAAFVVESHLKVMLEEDYVAFSNQPSAVSQLNAESRELKADTSKLSSEIIRELIIPELENEVNNGKNFAGLRQVYHSLILATWFKRNLKENLLSKVYVGQNKVEGVDIEDKDAKQKIYEAYLEAYKKGVYNFIKEEYDPAAEEEIPRKYFSGGFDFAKRTRAVIDETGTAREFAINPNRAMMATADFQRSDAPARPQTDRAMMGGADVQAIATMRPQEFYATLPADSNISKIIEAQGGLKDPKSVEPKNYDQENYKKLLELVYETPARISELLYGNWALEKGYTRLSSFSGPGNSAEPIEIPLQANELTAEQLLEWQTYQLTAVPSRRQILSIAIELRNSLIMGWGQATNPSETTLLFKQIEHQIFLWLLPDLTDAEADRFFGKETTAADVRQRASDLSWFVEQDDLRRNRQALEERVIDIMTEGIDSSEPVRDASGREYTLDTENLGDTLGEEQYGIFITRISDQSRSQSPAMEFSFSDLGLPVSGIIVSGYTLEDLAFSDDGAVNLISLRRILFERVMKIAAEAHDTFYITPDRLQDDDLETSTTAMREFMSGLTRNGEQIMTKDGLVIVDNPQDPQQTVGPNEITMNDALSAVFPIEAQWAREAGFNFDFIVPGKESRGVAGLKARHEEFQEKPVFDFFRIMVRKIGAPAPDRAMLSRDGIPQSDYESPHNRSVRKLWDDELVSRQLTFAKKGDEGKSRELLRDILHRESADRISTPEWFKLTVELLSYFQLIDLNASGKAAQFNQQLLDALQTEIPMEQRLTLAAIKRSTNQDQGMAFVKALQKIDNDDLRGELAGIIHRRAFQEKTPKEWAAHTEQLIGYAENAKKKSWGSYKRQLQAFLTELRSAVPVDRAMMAGQNLPGEAPYVYQAMEIPTDLLIGGTAVAALAGVGLAVWYWGFRAAAFERKVKRLARQISRAREDQPLSNEIQQALAAMNNPRTIARLRDYVREEALEDAKDGLEILLTLRARDLETKLLYNEVLDHFDDETIPDPNQYREIVRDLYQHRIEDILWRSGDPDRAMLTKEAVEEAMQTGSVELLQDAGAIGTQIYRVRNESVLGSKALIIKFWGSKFGIQGTINDGSTRLALGQFGEHFIPSAVLENVRVKTPEGQVLDPKTVLVQEEIQPFIQIKDDDVAGGLLMSPEIKADPAEGKRLIDQYLAMLENMWAMGIFNWDATINQVGRDAQGESRYFDAGGFKEFDSVETLFGNEDVTMQLRDFNESNVLLLRKTPPEVQQHYQAAAYSVLTMENLMKVWGRNRDLRKPVIAPSFDRAMMASLRSGEKAEIALSELQQTGSSLFVGWGNNLFKVSPSPVLEGNVFISDFVISGARFQVIHGLDENAGTAGGTIEIPVGRAMEVLFSASLREYIISANGKNYFMTAIGDRNYLESRDLFLPADSVRMRSVRVESGNIVVEVAPAVKSVTSVWSESPVDRAMMSGAEREKVRALQEKVLAAGYRIVGGIDFKISKGRVSQLYKFLQKHIGSGLLASAEKMYSPDNDLGISIEFIEFLYRSVGGNQVMEQLKREGKDTIRILVVGPGTGVDAFAALHFAESKGFTVDMDAVDIDPKAVQVTQFNYETFIKPLSEKSHQFRVRQVISGKEFESLTGAYDWIIFQAPDAVAQLRTDDRAIQMPAADYVRILEEVRDRLLAPFGAMTTANRFSVVDRSTSIIPAGLNAVVPTTLFGDLSDRPSDQRTSFTLFHAPNYSRPDNRNRAMMADGLGKPKQAAVALSKYLTTESAGSLVSEFSALRTYSVTKEELLSSLDIADEELTDGGLPIDSFSAMADLMREQDPGPETEKKIAMEKKRQDVLKKAVRHELAVVRRAVEAQPDGKLSREVTGKILDHLSPILATASAIFIFTKRIYSQDDPEMRVVPGDAYRYLFFKQEGFERRADAISLLASAYGLSDDAAAKIFEYAQVVIWESSSPNRAEAERVAKFLTEFKIGGGTPGMSIQGTLNQYDLSEIAVNLLRYQQWVSTQAWTLDEIAEAEREGLIILNPRDPELKKREDIAARLTKYVLIGSRISSLEQASLNDDVWEFLQGLSKSKVAGIVRFVTGTDEADIRMEQVDALMKISADMLKEARPESNLLDAIRERGGTPYLRNKRLFVQEAMRRLANPTLRVRPEDNAMMSQVDTENIMGKVFAGRFGWDDLAGLNLAILKRLRDRLDNEDRRLNGWEAVGDEDNAIRNDQDMARIGLARELVSSRIADLEAAASRAPESPAVSASAQTLEQKMLREGPMPVIEFPPVEDVLRAGRKFLNKETVTDDDLEILIKQVVPEDRDWLIRQYENSGSPTFTDKRLYLSGEMCNGMCVAAGEDVNTRVFSFNKGQMEFYLVNAARFFGPGHDDHNFVAVRVKGGKKTFLIDTTLRQFFALDEAGQIKRRPGRFLRERAPQVADKILKDGYIELTEEVLNLYAAAFRLTDTPRTESFTLQDIYSSRRAAKSAMVGSFFSAETFLSDFRRHGVYPQERADTLADYADRAMMGKPADVGGIDLNPANLNIEADGQNIQMNIPAIDIKMFEGPGFKGLTPFIIQIVPVTNLPLLLGTNEPVKEDKLSMAR